MADLQSSLPTQTPSQVPAAAPVAEGDDLDELGFLEEGGISELPVTAGLGVGPGPGPAGRTETTKVQRLRQIAQGASSPVLRHMARQALKAEISRGN